MTIDERRWRLEAAVAVLAGVMDPRGLDAEGLERLGFARAPGQSDSLFRAVVFEDGGAERVRRTCVRIVADALLAGYGAREMRGDWP